MFCVIVPCFQSQGWWYHSVLACAISFVDISLSTWRRKTKEFSGGKCFHIGRLCACSRAWMKKKDIVYTTCNTNRISERVLILYIKMKRFQRMYPIEKMDRSSEKTRVGDEMGLLWYWSLWCGRVDYGHSLVWEQRYEKRWDAITTRMMMMMLIILMIVCA